MCAVGARGERPVERRDGGRQGYVRPGVGRPGVGRPGVGRPGYAAPGSTRPGERRGGAGPYDATLRHLARAQQVFPVAAVQAELSVWAPQALEALLPWCVGHGVGFLAAMPLGSGYLTGTLTPGSGFEPDDLRARHPRFTAEMTAANQPIVAGLRRVAERHGATAAQVALAWTPARSPAVVPIPGAKNPRWTAENAAAADLVLTPADLAEIAALPPARGSWD